MTNDRPVYILIDHWSFVLYDVILKSWCYFLKTIELKLKNELITCCPFPISLRFLTTRLVIDYKIMYVLSNAKSVCSSVRLSI